MLQNKVVLVLLGAVAIIAVFSVFTVTETERAIKLQLGKVVRTDYEPGFHFKFPFVQNVLKFDSRIQILDLPPEAFLTSEKKNVQVDSFVEWRIKDVERFYTAAGGSERRAASRLAILIQKLLKDQFGKRTINEAVSGERAAIMEILTSELNEDAASLGLEIIDVRIKRIDLPQDVSSSVYERMQAERQEVAKDFRSRGEEVAKVIRARANRQREVLLAEAERDAQKSRGEGDGKATETYAEAYSQNPEFYSLYRSLNAYKTTFNDRSDVLVLEPDADFFKYFNDPYGGTRRAEQN